MTDSRNIIDEIDALVDEQMADGEPVGGYDYGDPDYPKCPHCYDDWHGLPITQRMRDMRYSFCGCAECRAELDAYRVGEDDSPVWCPGSEFIGPWANQTQLRRIREGVTSTEWGPAPGTWTLDSLVVTRSEMSFNPFTRREIPFTPGFDEVMRRRLMSMQERLRDLLNDAGLLWTPPANPFAFAPDPEPEPEPDTRSPKERAMPRPSSELPMWAVQPNRRPRRRNR